MLLNLSVVALAFSTLASCIFVEDYSNAIKKGLRHCRTFSSQKLAPFIRFLEDFAKEHRSLLEKLELDLVETAIVKDGQYNQFFAMHDEFVPIRFEYGEVENLLDLQSSLFKALNSSFAATSSRTLKSELVNVARNKVELVKTVDFSQIAMDYLDILLDQIDKYIPERNMSEILQYSAKHLMTLDSELSLGFFFCKYDIFQNSFYTYDFEKAESVKKMIMKFKDFLNSAEWKDFQSECSYWRKDGEEYYKGDIFNKPRGELIRVLRIVSGTISEYLELRLKDIKKSYETAKSMVLRGYDGNVAFGGASHADLYLRKYEKELVPLKTPWKERMELYKSYRNRVGFRSSEEKIDLDWVDVKENQEASFSVLVEDVEEEEEDDVKYFQHINSSPTYVNNEEYFAKHVGICENEYKNQSFVMSDFVFLEWEYFTPAEGVLARAKHLEKRAKTMV